jgi:hypothetical protein
VGNRVRRCDADLRPPGCLVSEVSGRLDELMTRPRLFVVSMRGTTILHRNAQFPTDPSTARPRLPVIDAPKALCIPRRCRSAADSGPAVGGKSPGAPPWTACRRILPRHPPLFPTNISKRYSNASTNATLPNYRWYLRSSRIAGPSALAGLTAGARPFATEEAGPHPASERARHACGPPIGDGGLQPGAATGLRPGPGQGHGAGRTRPKNPRKAGRTGVASKQREENR